MKKIGITPRFISGDGTSAGSSAVDRMAVVDANNQLVTRFGGLPLTLPMMRELDGVRRRDAFKTIVDCLDGLLLQGGTDVEPQRYGELPIKPEWAGDALRDRLEFDLIEAFLAADKPILGVCRGFQVLNVAFGGSLYQDIPMQHSRSAPEPNAKNQAPILHDTTASYCGAKHAIALSPQGVLATLYGTTHGQVNSAHHQGVRTLAGGLSLEAHAPDGICEGLRAPNYRFVLAVQWHPEFHHLDESLLPPLPLMQAFLTACEAV
jgi:putative glutamine amidotransferase